MKTQANDKLTFSKSKSSRSGNGNKQTKPVEIPDTEFRLPKPTIPWREVEQRRAQWMAKHADPLSGGYSYPLLDILNYDDGSDTYFAERLVYNPQLNVLYLNFRYDCAIDLDRIQTRISLAGWARHLCGKNWVTIDHIDEFLKVVCEIKGGGTLYKPNQRDRVTAMPSAKAMPP
jgi:hypothetical protein